MGTLEMHDSFTPYYDERKEITVKRSQPATRAPRRGERPQIAAVPMPARQGQQLTDTQKRP